MGQTVRFQEILRRLAIIDGGAVEQHTGLGRVVSAVPGLAIGLGYDVETALMETDDS